MKPILALWLAVLALLCLWFCLEPGSESERPEKVVVEKAAPWQEAAPVAMITAPSAMPLAVSALSQRSLVLHP